MRADAGDVILRLSHLIWGDNIWFLGGSAAELQTMLDEATAALLPCGVRWKPKSLEVLWGAAMPRDQQQELTVAEPDGSRLLFTSVEALAALGAWLTPTGETDTHQFHRARQADKAYFKHQKSLECRCTPVLPRLRAFAQAPGASYVYAAPIMNLTGATLTAAKVWENQWARRLARMRFAPGEHLGQFYQRSSQRIHAWFCREGLMRLHERMLKAHHVWTGQLWHEPWLDGMRSPLPDLEGWRTRAWWERIKCSENLRKCTRGERQALFRHSGTGVRPVREDLYVRCYGLQWRRLREDKELWAKLTWITVHRACEKMSLPTSTFVSRQVAKVLGPLSLDEYLRRRGYILVAGGAEEEDTHATDREESRGATARAPGPKRQKREALSEAERARLEERWRLGVELLEWIYSPGTQGALHAVGRLTLGVDSALTSRWVGGAAALQAARPATRRAWEHLVAMSTAVVDRGWMPHTRDLVAWLPREFNVAADALASGAVSLRRSRSWRAERGWKGAVNLLLTSDAGYKEAEGWVGWGWTLANVDSGQLLAVGAQGRQVEAGEVVDITAEELGAATMALGLFLAFAAGRLEAIPRESGGGFTAAERATLARKLPASVMRTRVR